MTDRKIAVVFVAYGCVPEQRIIDNFKWNWCFYRLQKTQIYTVTDDSGSGPLPRGQVVVPRSDLPVHDGKPVFSLCLTKNRGIQRAIADGADVIICTDVDIGFSESAWEMMCSVEPGQAIVPVYHLCADFDNRHNEPSRVDYGMTGTTAMVAEHWKEIQYDERCVGYGADDGILLRDIQRAGVELIPPVRKYPAAPVVWHVDHTTATVDNVPGSGRSDCWGREEGFNPDNFAENRKLHDTRTRRVR